MERLVLLLNVVATGLLLITIVLCDGDPYPLDRKLDPVTVTGIAVERAVMGDGETALMAGGNTTNDTELEVVLPCVTEMPNDCAVYESVAGMVAVAVVELMTVVAKVVARNLR